MKTIIQRIIVPGEPVNGKGIIADSISYLFIMLFIYTVASKMRSFSAFQFVLKQSPVFGDYNISISWFIISSQLIISIVLLFERTKFVGLILSISLITLFTSYLVYMVTSGTVLMCSCGGVIDKMGWKQHIWFNVAFIILGLVGLVVMRKSDRTSIST